MLITPIMIFPFNFFEYINKKIVLNEKISSNYDIIPKVVLTALITVFFLSLCVYNIYTQFFVITFFKLNTLTIFSNSISYKIKNGIKRRRCTKKHLKSFVSFSRGSTVTAIYFSWRSTTVMVIFYSRDSTVTTIFF